MMQHDNASPFRRKIADFTYRLVAGSMLLACSGDVDTELPVTPRSGGIAAFQVSAILQWPWENPMSPNRDRANGVAVDDEGSAYVAGYTAGDGFDHLGGYTDLFVLKVTPSGPTDWNLAWGAQFGMGFPHWTTPSPAEEYEGSVAVNETHVVIGGHICRQLCG